MSAAAAAAAPQCDTRVGGASTRGEHLQVWQRHPLI